MKAISRFFALTGCLLISTFALGNQAPAPMQSPVTASPQIDSKTATTANAPATTPPVAPQTSATGDNSCSGACCEPQMVQRTVYVPVPVRETRKVECVEYSTEQRQQTITVMHAVPEKQTMTRDYIVMVPQKRTRTENYTVCKPAPTSDCCGSCKTVEEQRQRVIEYTVCVPQTKTCTYDVTVCKYVPEQKSITVCVCVPHTVEKEVEVCAYRLTPKKISCPVPCCPPVCCGCGGGCGWDSWCW